MNKDRPAATRPSLMAWAALAGYIPFCCLNPLAHLLSKDVFGEFLDVLMMSAFLWPYPLLLGLQRFVHPDSSWVWLAADLAGLALVFLAASGLDKLLCRRELGRSVRIALGLLCLPVVLGLLEGTVVLIAFSMGWPVGE